MDDRICAARSTLRAAPVMLMQCDDVKTTLNPITELSRAVRYLLMMVIAGSCSMRYDPDVFNCVPMSRAMLFNDELFARDLAALPGFGLLFLTRVKASSMLTLLQQRRRILCGSVTVPSAQLFAIEVRSDTRTAGDPPALRELIWSMMLSQTALVGAVVEVSMTYLCY